MKGNSTNVHVSNVVCHESGAMCIGSIGSDPAQPDFVENMYYDNVTAYHSSNAAWIKTYSGQGRVCNVTFANMRFDNVNQTIYITPCIYGSSGCDSSRLGIEDVRWLTSQEPADITWLQVYTVAPRHHAKTSRWRI